MNRYAIAVAATLLTFSSQANAVTELDVQPAVADLLDDGVQRVDLRSKAIVPVRGQARLEGSGTPGGIVRVFSLPANGATLLPFSDIPKSDHLRLTVQVGDASKSATDVDVQSECKLDHGVLSPSMARRVTLLIQSNPDPKRNVSCQLGS